VHVTSWADLGELEPSGGRLLIATPLLVDPHFVRTVVYVLEHDGGGTVGVILNRPSHTPVGQVLPSWHDAVSGPSVVFNGGPVQPDGALCLGQVATDGPGVRAVVDGVATVDLDGDVAVITGLTRRLRVFAGHAGWAPEQLDAEIAEGAWWVVPGSPGDLFSEDPRPMWTRVLRRQPPPLNLVSTYPADPLLN
jgi:putative transcriptional regulator